MSTVSMKSTRVSLLASAALVGLLGASPALAAESGAAPAASADQSDAMETVTVTAQRRVEREQDVPITITTINADELKQAGVTNLSDIATVTPALRFDSAGAYFQPTIRGVGSAVTTSGSGGNVGIYVDGFYSPAPLAANFQFLNIDNVQVLKGPQGTLFGHNTTGGAILVTTTKPSHDTHGTVEASYGSYNTQRYQGYFTTGLTDNIAFDIAGIFSQGDGYVKDIVTGSKKDGAFQNWTIRTGLQVDVTSDISFLFRYAHTETDDPTNYLFNAYVVNGAPWVAGAPWNAVGFPPYPPAFYATKPHEVANLGATTYRAKSDTFQLTSTFDLNFATLTSYTQYSTLDAGVDNFDLSINSIAAGPLGVRPLFEINLYNKGGHTLTQEFLLNSNSEGRLKWTAGAFYMDWTDPFHVYVRSPLGTPGYPAYLDGGPTMTDTTSLAVYADATYQVLDDLYLSGGLRYSHDDADAGTIRGFSGVVPKLSGDHVTPRAVLRYTPNDHSSVYFSFSRGFKAGIYNTTNVTLASQAIVKPETIDAYEIGYKYATRGLSLDLSSFYYDYTNLQISEYLSTGTTGTGSFTINAASSRIYGLEGHVNYDVTPSFNVNVGAAYAKAEYTDLANAPIFVQCTTFPGCIIGGTPTGYGFLEVAPQNLHNVPMLRAPEFTSSLGARYTTELAGGGLTFSGNLYYTSKFYFDPAQQLAQNGYALLGLRAEWTDPSGKYSVAVFGDNVTDTDYRASIQETQRGVGNTWGAPATFGIEAKARF